MQKLGYIRAQQFNSSVTCPIENNLLDRDGTSKVLGNKKDGDRETVPAPITGYVTPFALTMHLLFGLVELERSKGSNVM